MMLPMHLVEPPPLLRAQRPQHMMRSGTAVPEEPLNLSRKPIKAIQ
jgi:hypothetical protein